MRERGRGGKREKHRVEGEEEEGEETSNGEGGELIHLRGRSSITNTATIAYRSSITNTAKSYYRSSITNTAKRKVLIVVLYSL